MVIAGYSAAIKLNNMVITTFTALGNGISNFSAQNIGAGKPERIKKGHAAGIRLAIVVYVPVLILYYCFGDILVNFFMDKEGADSLRVGVEFLRIVSPFYIVVATKLISDGVLRGLGAMNQFMIATLTDLVLRVVLAFVLSARWEETGIWSAWPVGWIIGTLISFVFCIRLIKRINITKSLEQPKEG